MASACSQYIRLLWENNFLMSYNKKGSVTSLARFCAVESLAKSVILLEEAFVMWQKDRISTEVS